MSGERQIRIIHTADWHLGQHFFEYDRRAEHTRFLTWLKNVLRDRQADVLLIAGDVFDSPNPSADSQKMYYAFMREATSENPGLQIIIIAGNHDSAARLEAPSPLFEEMHIDVRGTVRRTAGGDIDYARLIVPLKKGGYCLAVPYLRQGDYPDAENYSQAVRILYEKLFDLVPDKHLPVIAMGHLHATGSEISENDRSERTVIGGLECVSPDAFGSGITYTALGHLHRAQHISGRENVRYAGAPIPMSFAEKNNSQGVVLIELGDEVKIERIKFEDTVRLITLPRDPKPLHEVLEELGRLPEGEADEHSPYLEIKIRITEPEPSLRHQIEEALKGKAVRLTRIEAVTAGRKDAENSLEHEELQTIHPMDLAMKIFERQYGGEPMPDAMRQLLQQTLREVEGAL